MPEKSVRLPGTEGSLRFCFLTRSLEIGGAERQLVLLANLLAEGGHSVKIISMYNQVPLADGLNLDAVELSVLGKKGRWEVIRFLRDCAKEVREFQPVYLYSFLVVPNIIAVFLKYYLGGFKVIWGLRASNMDLSQYDFFSRITYKLCALVSPLADTIIANSKAGAEFASKTGIQGRVHVVHNAIDLARFYPCELSRKSFRKVFRVGEDELVLACVARLDPMKGHPVLLKALSRLVESGYNFKFICLGTGDEDYLRELEGMAASLGLEKIVYWFPGFERMNDFYNGVDMVVSSSSFGEGFSNAIAEAMACNTVVVSTNVGDSAIIVQDENLLSEPNDASGLVEAISYGLAQLRIDANFTREKVVKFSGQALLHNTLSALGDEP